jgi:hypothetical protein
MQKSCEFDLIEIKFFCWLDQTKILVTYTFGYWSEVLLFPGLSLRAAAACCWCFTAQIFAAVRLFDLQLTMLCLNSNSQCVFAALVAAPS